MTTLLALLAQATQPTIEQTAATVSATAPASQPAATPPWWAQFVNGYVLIGVLAIFWIFMLKNKRSQDQQRKDMLGQLKRGDRIQTIGGIIGNVVEARDDEVVVKVDESQNTKIKFAHSAIYKVLEAEKTEKK